MKPSLHIQNIFDAFDPHGIGVNGYLKLWSLQLQNRVVGLAKRGDIIAVSSDCSYAFIEYMLRTTQASDVLSLRYPVSRDPRTYLDSHSVFDGLACDPRWKTALQRSPVLSPYMKSAAIYETARDSGIPVSQSEWKAAVTNRLTESMNDKALFYQECSQAGIPVPQHWVASGKDLTKCVIDLLKTHGPLYIRQTKTGGTIGNIAVEKIDSNYLIQEFSPRMLNDSEFIRVLERFIKASFWDEFLITEMLDLHASPGTLFYADDTDVTVICHTYQLLNRNRLFLGFTYPIEDERISRHFGSIEEWVRVLIEPWRQLGYRGYGNIDSMITKDGETFLAERNPRQTAVVLPLTIANTLSGMATGSHSISAPALSIYTRDIVDLERASTFEEVYARLGKKKLLLEQNKHGEGVIITIPPSPRFGLNGVGIMAVGSNLSTAYEIYSRALYELASEESNLLFDHKI